MELLPTRYLSVAGEYAGAVHIPLAELERRTHELPPPVREVWVVADSQEAYYALGWLHARGRRARLVPAPPPDADPTARYRLWEPNEWLETVLYAWETATQAEFRIAPLLQVPPTSRGEPSAGVANPASRGEPRGGSVPPAGRGNQRRGSLSQHLRALDLGCGSGREAVYLAAQGWQVVAVDRLPEALQRGRDLQHRYAPDSPPIQWVCADLEKSDWQPDGKFDCILLFYFYARALIARACAWLKPGGALLVEAFTATHRARFGKPASDTRVAQPDELPSLLPDGMRVVAYSEGWRTSGRHTARLWAIRKQ
ncbi:class I SAM-dependent methyltransferase [Synechococcus sp. RC10B2]|uniref:methyltransferase domain-containing protein n=1 Tax=Synechococcus sp. RC10B2 TaxID=2964530 RepID=UPI0039C6FE1E